MMCLWKKKPKQPKETLELPESLKVTSTIKSKIDVEKIVKILLWEVYGYKTMNVIVQDGTRMLKQLSNGDVEYSAFLHKSPILHSYNLYINPNKDILTILCHEMVHLNQYEKGWLKAVEGKDPHFIWKGKKYDGDYQYDRRPWEVEAFSEQQTNRMKLKKYI